MPRPRPQNKTPAASGRGKSSHQYLELQHLEDYSTWRITALGGLQAIKNLIGPEALQPMQRLIERRELIGIDAADLLNRPHVLLVKRLDDVAHLTALVGQLDANRTAIDARALMIEKRHLDQLLQIVGDVGAEIVAARAQFTRGQLLVANIVEQQRLHRIDVGAAAAVEFVLDDVEQPAVQPLNQGQGFVV